MKKKLPIITRGIIVTALLLLVASLLNTTPVQSAYPNAINADPTLTLTKIMITDNGGTATQADFQAQIDEGDVAWDTAIPVTPDVQHTASEVAQVTGYTASVWGLPCAEDGTITLAADTTATCSITNDDIPPSLTLTKLVTNNNGGTAEPANWTLTATGPPTITGAGGAVSDETFQAGTYTLSETANPPGYTSGSWICTGGSQVGNEITLAVGEIVSCTITSDDDVPSLTLSKTVVNDHGGTAIAADWTISANGTSTPISGSGGAVSDSTFQAGTYTLSEIGPSGYLASDWVCTGGVQVGNLITIALGESVSCSITNDDILPTLTVIKNVINDAGGTLTPADFTINITGSYVSLPSFPGAEAPGTTVTLFPGSFSVNEIPVIGYSTAYSADCSGTIAISNTKTCTITNNDTAAIKVSPAGGLETEENGTTDSFNVVLTTMPANEVTIKVSSSDLTEGIVDKAILNFNNVNWHIPKTIKITGVDDYVIDGDINYQITLDPKSSVDTNYNGLPKIQISATNLDAPSIEWIKPVGNGEVYFIDNFNPIVIEVRNPGNEPIHKVEIVRWVPSANDWDTIAEFFSLPYRITVNPSEFDIEWNELRTRAWGPPGDNQRFSAQPFIFIYKGYGVFMPLVAK